MAVTDLTTLANVKAYLGLAGASDDALITRMITGLSGVAEAWMGRPILSFAYNELRNGSGSRRLAMTNYPVTSVTELLINTLAIPAAPDAVSPGYRFDERFLYLNGYRFCHGMANVNVAYVAGYATVPPELEQAVIELIAAKYRERERIGHQSKSLAGEATTFIVKDLPDAVKSVFMNYKKVVPL